jgi:hypothetical protein
LLQSLGGVHGHLACRAVVLPALTGRTTVIRIFNGRQLQSGFSEERLPETEGAASVRKKLGARLYD